MSLNRGVLSGDRDRDLFVGWDTTPPMDRRFLLGAIPLVILGAGAIGYGLARRLGDPGAGAWRTNELARVTGILATRPYPMIFVADPAARDGVRTVLIVAQGKCTSALDLTAADGRVFEASGALIERGRRQMLEVPLAVGDWLRPVATAVRLPPLRAEPLGRIRLIGQIMDSKCFFGVMRPGTGRPHKACASLCIRGGVPPSFWARSEDGREAVLLMTNADGGAIGQAILPLVAEPVEAEGELVRVGDIVQFRADAQSFRRL